MSRNIEFMLGFRDNNPVQLSEADQKAYELPKHTTVGDVRKAIEAKKVKPKSMKMVIKEDDSTEL